MNGGVITCPNQPACLEVRGTQAGRCVGGRDSNLVGVERAAFGGTELAEVKHLWPFNFHL
jgi:hypothetical protein